MYLNTVPNTAVLIEWQSCCIWLTSIPSGKN